MEHQDSYIIKVLQNGWSSDGKIELYEDEDSCRVDLHWNQNIFSFTASDYFKALQDIRSQLESDQVVLCCYGSCINVYPSNMSRSMGGGYKAYKLALGKHAKQADLVDIFEQATDGDFASVDRQNEFYNLWLDSTKGDFA